jgi:pectin lyase
MNLEFRIHLGPNQPSGLPTPSESQAGPQTNTKGTNNAALQLLMPILEQLLQGKNNQSQPQGNSGGAADGQPSSKLGNLMDRNSGAGGAGASGLGGANGMSNMESLVDLLNQMMQSLFERANKQGNSPSSGASSTGASTPQMNNQPSPHDVAPAVLQDAGGAALKGAVSPAKDGGGQINNQYPEMTKAVTGMMDNNKETFGTPSAPTKSVDTKSVESGTANIAANTGGLSTEASDKTSKVTSSQRLGSTEGMEGFAKAAGVKGGTGGETVTVNSVGELKQALAGDEPRIIKLGSDISATEKTNLEFGANKTLVGDGDNNKLHNIYLRSGEGAGNDVFQNLHFSHDAKYNANGDIPLYIDKGEGYWIDHNTFSGTKDQQGADDHSKDKLLYVGGTADNVSLTNSKFENNKYGLILGYPEDTKEASDKYSGYPRMTIAHNDFEDLSTRAPGLMRYGQFDVYNNHIDDFNLGFTAHTGATIVSEGNFFENGRNGGGQPSMVGVLADAGVAKGFIDIGSNISVEGQKSPETSWRGGPYDRNVMSAAEAKEFASNNAGAQGSGELKFAS